MQNTQALAISQWLEKPTGLRVALSVISIVPVVAVVLDIVGLTVMGVKLASVGNIFFGWMLLVVFWICGKSLMRAIDESLEHQKERTGNDHTAANERGKLVAAKKKTAKMLGFVLQQVVMISIVNSFAVFSDYRTAAPLLLFGLPMALVSHAVSVASLYRFLPAPVTTSTILLHTYVFLYFHSTIDCDVTCLAIVCRPDATACPHSRRPTFRREEQTRWGRSLQYSVISR